MDFETFRNQAIGQMIREATQKESQFIDRYLQDHLGKSVHHVEGMMLGYIYDNQDKKIQANDIVKTFHLSKATVSQTLHRLLDKGFVTFTDGEDHRNKVIHLTEEGKKAHEDFRSCFRNITETLENGFTEKEKEQLSVLLFRFWNNAEIK